MAFERSVIQDSTANTDAYKCGPQGIMANNSPIHQLIINNTFHGDSQTERQISNDVQQTPTQVPHTDQQETSEIRNPSVEPSNRFKIPSSISRLENRDESAQIPKSPRPIGGSGHSITGRSTIGGKSPPQFKAISLSRDAMRHKLKSQVTSSVIRQYMQSDFFFSDNAIPLWEPSPGYNLRSKISNVCVGDVGIFTPDGGFHVLFNAFLSRTKNVELGFTPPDDFEPYDEFIQFSEEVSRITPMSLSKYVSLEGDFKSDPEIPRHRDYPKRKYVRAYHLVRKYSKYSKGVRSGTLLDLPNGVWRDRMHPTTVFALQGYFDLHAESWYNLRTEQYSGPIPTGLLNIVTTSYKCSTWAFSIGDTKSPDKTHARLSPYPNFKILYEWDTHDDIVGWTGPLSEEKGDDGEPLTNQCVAIEVYSIEKTRNLQAVGSSSLSRIMSRMSIRSTMSRLSTVKRR